MTITIHSPFKASPRISREGFITILDRVGSFKSEPLWGPYPGDELPYIAGDIYDDLVEHGHDPAVFLAIAGKEHTFGTNLDSVLGRNHTRSWTNARSIRHPDVQGEIITDSYRRSQYVRYRDVRDSVRDGWYRIDDPGFAYQQAGAETIADVIAIWAPSDDQNDPAGYSRTMVNWINQWAAEFPPEEQDMSTINGVPLRIDWIPRGNSNRPGYAMVPEWITVHETGNPNRGANAEMHRRFVNAGGGSGNVSWHYTVDDSEIIQHLPLTENGWHAGDGGNGTGNRKSIGIETCINADGDWGKTLDNLARLIVWLQAEYNIPETRIVQHNHWSGKNCPARMRASGGRGWRDLLTMVTGYRDERPPEADDPCTYYPQTGFYSCHGFRGFHEDNGGIPIFGYPLSREFRRISENGKEVVSQWYERALLEHQPDISDNKHGVVLARIGAESRKQDQEHYPEAFERQEPPT